MQEGDAPSQEAIPRVSVVTPFYNTAEFLEECIRSVLAQTFEDFEYILVDNCSTDGSGDIAARYAGQEPRIRLIRNQEFLGQVDNFNWALRQIDPRSLYTKMVLADDWIYPRCLEEMVAVADRDPDVNLVSAFRLKSDRVENAGIAAGNEISPGRDICRRQLMFDHHYFGTSTSVLYRSSIVRSKYPFFEPGRLHEDTEVCYEILRSGKFGFVYQVLSFTRTGNDSVMTSVRNFHPHVLDRLIIMRRYGREYLGEEFASQWRRCERRYLGLIARSHLLGQSADFWEYHRRGQQLVDYKVPRGALLWVVVKELLGLMLHPKMLASSFAKRFRSS